MHIIMSMSQEKSQYLIKERLESSLCLFKMAGMMFFLSICMITALFLSVGTIVILCDFMIKFFF
ncbi:MAG: hypothetical protein ACLRVU_06075 [Beduini sp.]|uniref:hypothetical protein n=1 Tax=Beduini sp. TaxID=1922300 RepID=UPI0039A3023C